VYAILSLKSIRLKNHTLIPIQNENEKNVNMLLELSTTSTAGE
jgi:hypothetical protein